MRLNKHRLVEISTKPVKINLDRIYYNKITSRKLIVIPFQNYNHYLPSFTGKQGKRGVIGVSSIIVYFILTILRNYGIIIIILIIPIIILSKDYFIGH